MSLFLETIKINNGRRINLDGHSRRMNKTRNHHFHEIRNIDLEGIIEVPEAFGKGIVKCRVTYGRSIEKVEFENYTFRNPRTFKFVIADHLEYEYKSANRAELRALYGLRGMADDIIMVRKGLVTDSFYANVAFLKEDQWYTPLKPLLPGTFREKLIANEKLVEVNIYANQLMGFDKVKIFNALTEWEMHEPVACSAINSELFYT